MRLTDEQLAELERLEQEAAWPAPWRAHTFEIDCPCPNGDGCGNSHDCAEVESPEAYPDSHEEPANLGEGQCVVQISVPGLESLAGPNAEFIAAARNALPALLAEVRDARRAALAQPPGPAPSMEEVERLVDQLVDDCQEWCPEHDRKCNAKHRAREMATRAALMASIRALPDRYAEGWQEGVRAAATTVDAFGEGGHADGDCGCPEFPCDLCVLHGTIRSLPTPNPEDRR